MALAYWHALSTTNSEISNVVYYKHIFRKDEGHLEDSPANRELLLNLAKDPTKFVGLDGYGNSWNAEIVDGGKQLWVRYQHGVINEGGLNSSPKPWDPVTGFNRNPFDRK